MDIPFRTNGRLNTAKLKQIEQEVIKSAPENLKCLPLQQLVWHLHNGVDSVPLCFCGAPRFFKGFGKGYAAACNPNCIGVAQSRELSLLSKYGVKNVLCLENVKEKIKQTNMQKYGTPYFSQSDIGKQKIKESVKSKLGVDYPTQCKKVTQKRKENSIAKYGVESPSKLQCVKDKAEKTNLAKYGSKTWNSTENGRISVSLRLKEHHDAVNPNRLKLEDHEFVLHRYDQLKSLTLLAGELGVQVNYLSRWFAKNGYKADKTCNVSSIEHEIVEWLKTLGVEPRVRDRTTIKPYELDVVVGNLAIEVNGIYWHSFDHLETNEERNRHLHKLQLCEAAGISLIQFTDIEWNSKRDIIKSIILNRLGKANKIFARKTVVKHISNSTIRDFLLENHFQGHVPAKVNLGLYLGDELVAVMNFGKPRFAKNAEWELLRFATKKNVMVVGGAQKLLTAFKKEHKGSILSYSDRMKFSGKMYSTLGFVQIKVNGPSYFYTDKNVLMSRVKFQKHKLHKMFNNFDPNLSEAQNCFNNGLRRYWDCGTITWLLSD